MFYITFTAPVDIGVYTITSTSTIPQNALSSNTMLSKSYSFTLTVQSDCVNTIISDKVINSMSNKISLAAVTLDVSFLDSIATGHSIPAYCGSRKYTLDPILTFLSLSGTTLSLETSSVADVRVYNVKMVVSLTDYPLVASIQKTIVVTITCEV